ncbi:MAG: response regulator [Campylobacterales bacterium]|nr:response regulator [Campylobacterales bacterium]
MDANALKHLRSLLHPYSLLYVEDNEGLNAQATIMFKKLFDTFYSALDGEEGLKLFEKHRPEIVITDITMPKMDGLSMVAAILKIEPETKIIVTTAYDEISFLHRSIQLGVFDYLKKPLKIDEILVTLERCVKVLDEALHQKLFNANLHTIFNYQNNLLLLLHNRSVVMANHPCLDFFGVTTIEELKKKFATFEQLLLKHNGFLYNHDEIEWFDEISTHIGRLFNTKIASTDNVSHHFILSFQTIPEKEGYSVLSFNDVTELGLLKLYDPNALEHERLIKDENMVRGLLEMALRSGAKIKVHNFYKGLTITNDGLIISVEEQKASLKTPYIQLKAIQLAEMFYLTSDLFPLTIEAKGIKRIDFDNQTVQFINYTLVQTSPIRRDAIRVVPDAAMQVTILYEGRKFGSDLKISDVSIKGMRIQLSLLPSGFTVNKSVILDMVITNELRPVIINTPAVVFRIAEVNHRFEVVFIYDLHAQGKKTLIDYVSKRQLVLIREFKGLQL